MKRFVIISIIVLLSSTIYSGAQNNMKALKQDLKELSTGLTKNIKNKKVLEEKKRELSEKYVGKKVYLLKDSGCSRYFNTRAPREYSTTGDICLVGNPGHQLYSLSDTIIVRKELKYYICTEVYPVREFDRYEKPDALAMKLFDGRNDNPVLVYRNGYCGPLHYEGHGYDGGVTSITVRSNVGILQTTMPEAFVTDIELDSIAFVLQKQYSEKLALKRKQETEAAAAREKAEAEAAAAREKARAEAAREKARAEAERMKAEDDAENEKEKARSFAINQTKQQIAYMSDHYELKAQNCKSYSGNMSVPKWLDGLFISPFVITGTYCYYEDDDEVRIPHGQFIVTYATSVLTGVSRYEIKGRFKHGFRDGLWTIKAKNANDEYLNDFLYQFQYTDGLLNGDFVFIISKDYHHEEIKGTFADGRLTVPVCIMKSELLDLGFTLFEGTVNDKGLPHGVWKEANIYSVNAPTKCERLYYNGCLVYRRKKDESTGEITYTEKISEEIIKPADFDKIKRISTYTAEINGVRYSIVEGENDLYIDDSVFCQIYPAMNEWKVKLEKKKE